MRIGIIGAGMAGIRILYEYIQHKDVDVVIFDAPHYAGRGGPFIHDHSSLLLNQPQTYMSLDDTADGFVRWLNENLPEQVDERFTSRTDFGKYAVDTFHKYIESPNARFIPKRIQKCLKNGRRFILVDEDGENHHFDGVHVACGPLPYQDPYELKGTPGYHGKPYPLSQLWQEIQNESSIGIIGQGLASVDVAVFLEDMGYDGRQVYFSTTGFFPTIRGEHMELDYKYIPKVLQERSGSLDVLLEAVMNEGKDKGIDFKKLIPQPSMDGRAYLEYQMENLEDFAIGQLIVTEYSQSFPSYWNRMNRKDQMEFFKKYSGYFTLLQSPMPIESAKKILRSYARGKTVSYNDIKEIKASDAGFVLQRKESQLRVPRLMNATGVGSLGKPMAYENAAKTLVESMYNEFLLETHDGGGFMATYPGLSAISMRYGVIDHLKLHGSLVRNVMFPNNAIETLAMEANNAVESMLLLAE